MIPRKIHNLSKTQNLLSIDPNPETLTAEISRRRTSCTAMKASSSSRYFLSLFNKSLNPERRSTSFWSSHRPSSSLSFFSSSVLLSSLDLTNKHVYEPEIRARLGTASNFCSWYLEQKGDTLQRRAFARFCSGPVSGLNERPHQGFGTAKSCRTC